LNKLISIIGLGSVGLVSAVVFASKGYKVVGVDNDVDNVRAVNNGRCYLSEPGLDVLLRDVVSKGFLRATTDVLEAVKESDAVVIAVPTPVRDGIADLSYLRDALESVRRGLHRGLLIVIESTIPPSTTAGFARSLLEESGLRVEEDFYLAYVPERIASGRAVEELLNMPGVVGGVGLRSTEKAVELYSRVNPKLLTTDATTAEFVKLAENTYRDLNIAYANLLAVLAEKLGIDVYEAIRLANTHQRVHIHMPGAGVGGPCLTKDPYMLISVDPDFWGSELVKIARRINDYMPIHTIKIVEKALREAGLEINSARITVLGAAYKGGVSDTRESPSKHIVGELIKKGSKVIVYDPYTSETFGGERSLSLEDAVKDSDAIVIVTDHPEFKNIDLDVIGRIMRHKIIIDGRRVIEPYQAVKHGFRYYGVGFGRAYRL
jgi:UDP-N-acetyl-D-mannosaminuronic acid dehydrogenase